MRKKLVIFLRKGLFMSHFRHFNAFLWYISKFVSVGKSVQLAVLSVFADSFCRVVARLRAAKSHCK